MWVFFLEVQQAKWICGNRGQKSGHLWVERQVAGHERSFWVPNNVSHFDLGQWFSPGGSFDLQRILGDVCIHLGLPQLGQQKGCCWHPVGRSQESSGPRCQWCQGGRILIWWLVLTQENYVKNSWSSASEVYVLDCSVFKSHHGMYAGALLYLEAHFLISQSVMAHW